MRTPKEQSQHTLPKPASPFINTTILKNRPAIIGIISFILLSVLIGALITQRYNSLQQHLKEEAFAELQNARLRLQETLSHGLTAAKTLSFFIDNNGHINNFDSIAAEIFETSKSIDALQLVPAGVIQYVYPLKGNESVIGYDILKDSSRNIEAYKAIQKKEMFFAGPFDLRQGGLGVVGRLPVYRNDRFWGFSAVVIKMNTLLNSAGINTKGNPTYSFQLSKLNPETNEDEYFIYEDKIHFSEQLISVTVPNGEWKLSILPVKQPKFGLNIILIAILGFLFSVFGSFFIYEILLRREKLTKLVKVKTQVLKYTDNKYRSLIQQASDGIVITDMAGTIREVNNSIALMLGYSAEEMTGCLLNQFIPKEDNINNPIKLEELKQGKSLLHERRLLRKDGSYLAVEINAKMTGEETIIGFIRNISKRKKNEETLRYQASILACVSEAVVSLNMNKEIVSWNHASKALFGFSESQALGKRIPQLVTFDFENSTTDEVFKKLINEGSWKGEYNFIHPVRNLKIHTLSTLNLLIDSDEKHIGYIITSRDISSRKSAVEELKFSNERYEMIAMATNDIIWDHHFEQNKTWGNDKLFTLYGIEKGSEKLDFDRFLNHVHPDEKEEIAQGLNNAIKRKLHSFNAEFRFKMPDGEYRVFYDRAFIKYDSKGKPQRILGAMQDITDNKKAAEKLKKNADLLRELYIYIQNIREEEKTIIAKEIYDELGQQLSGIKMDMSWIAGKLNPEDALIKNKIKSTIELVDSSIKSVRKIAADLRPGMLDDLGLVAALEWQSEEFGKQYKVTVNFTGNPDETNIRTEIKTAVFRIFQELLTNIGRHAKAAIIDTTLYIEDGKLFLNVKDDGIGFKENEIENKKTIGLGGIKERMKLISGTYEINSSPGRGTHVMICVPL